MPDRCIVERDVGQTTVTTTTTTTTTTNRYALHFEESESLQAVYARDEIPNSFTVPVRLLADIMANFQHGTEEIVFAATAEGLSIENYIPDE